MSDGAAPPPPPRHAQGDALIAAIHRNTAAIVGLAAAVGVLIATVQANTAATRELLEADDDEPDVCEDCGDEDCDGDCDDDAPPRKRRR